MLFAIGGIGGGSFLILRATIVALGLGTGAFEGATLLHPSLVAHFFGVAPLVVGWLLMTPQRSAQALLTIESACLVPSTLAYIFMESTAYKSDVSDLALVLILTYIFVMRAALIPSSATRTAALTGVVVVPLIGVAWYGRTELGQTAQVIGVNTAFLIAWWGTTTASATLISHVIWGLRTEVREARKIGRYTLEEKLGEGGMGVVFRASHARLRRPVAIKMLRPGGLSGDDVARFEREAQITAGLQSPHTIQLYDFGQVPDGRCYYAMELLDGFDLQAFVGRFGPIPPGRLVHWLLQACHSLEEAHAAELVHRDIKPSNLYVCRRGLERDVVKILDFGLVKPKAELAGADPILTAAGSFRGTPAYLAPESVTVGDVDQRSDIYSLGCVAWFLLVGREPFLADSPIQVLMKHVGEAPLPPSEASEFDVPPALDALILSCLEKDPAARVQTVDGVRRALEAIPIAQPWDRSRSLAWWQSHLAT